MLKLTGAKNMSHQLKVGYPSKTPLKGTIISAKCTGKNKNNYCVPPHVLLFKDGRQGDPEVAIVSTEPDTSNFEIAGISISGILSPKGALDYPDSDGRFALIFAGQARLVARKQLGESKTDAFKMLDDIYVASEHGGWHKDCVMDYNDETKYESPSFWDHKREGALKVGTVIGVTEDTDLITVELVPQCSGADDAESDTAEDEEESSTGPRASVRAEVPGRIEREA